MVTLLGLLLCVQNGTTPGTIQVEEPTFVCLGVRWTITGDANLNCAVAVQYRQQGATAWKPAQPLLRVEPGGMNQNGFDPGNLLAGSIFGLTPGTTYELQLSLSDPDGGASTQVVTATTRSYPTDPPAPNARYVVPGSGGGTGTQADPFKGIAAANAAAQPGDVFLLQAGTYAGAVSFTKSGTAANPIVWRGVDVNTVILDGLGTAQPLVALNGVSHVHLDSITMKNPDRTTLRAYGPTDGLVIRKCRIDLWTGVNPGKEMHGILIMGAGHKRAWVTENWIRGPIVWESGRVQDGYGLDVVGNGHVVSYNEVFNWWDCVRPGANATSAIESSSVDVYGNEIYNGTDDLIEADDSRHNVRIFDNRLTNGLTALSCQPTFGGPLYFLRNACYNIQLKPLKWQTWPSGMIAMHNTFVVADPRGSGADGGWSNGVLRNNIFIGRSTSPGAPWSNVICFAHDQTARANQDYNGWYQANPTRFATYNGGFYATLAAFQSATGMETHAVLLNLAALNGAVEPALGPWLGQTSFPAAYAPGSQDLRLSAGSVAIDKGQVLANINDGFGGAAPDLGAYEHGQSIPVYGPAGAPGGAGGGGGASSGRRSGKEGCGSIGLDVLLAGFVLHRTLRAIRRRATP